MAGWRCGQVTGCDSDIFEDSGQRANGVAGLQYRSQCNMGTQSSSSSSTLIPPTATIQAGGRLDVRRLSVRFASAAQDEALALSHVDLSIAPGEFVVALGPSGCGKTTLLNCLAGFVQASQGEACTKPARQLSSVVLPQP